MPKLLIMMFLFASSAFAQNCLPNIKKVTDFIQIQTSSSEEFMDIYKEAELEIEINKGLDYLVSRKAFDTEKYKACCQTGDKSVANFEINDEMAQKARIMLWKMYDGLDAEGQEVLENKVRWLDQDLVNACLSETK